MPTLTISSDVLARVLRDIHSIRAMRPDQAGSYSYSYALGKCNGLAMTISAALEAHVSGECDCGNDCDYTGQCECCKGVDAACDAGDAEYHRVAEGD